MKTYDDDVWTPAMVAEVFRVTPHTVSRWAAEGKLRCFKTPGGHRRFRRADIEQLVKETFGEA